MYITSLEKATAAGTAHALPDGSAVTTLVSRDICGAEGGEIAMVTVPAGVTRHLPRTPVEIGSVLVAGDAVVSVDEASGPGAGTALFVPPGSSFTVAAQRLAASLLAYVGGSVRWTDTDHHNAGGAAGPADLFAVADQENHPFDIPDMGFFDMHARWLVDKATRGSSTLTLGQSTFAPGTGRHALHRHPSAEEVFYVWEGQAVHLTEDGAEHPMKAGELVFVPRNEWHGVRNVGDTPMRAIFGYLGAESLDAGGYELPQG
ncbi:cupin domain-containing protein [Pseudonocardia sp. ICBG1034]|uniref:cupin domain-containing protein n=1 Tax=Pseudonocardia sp. ICBG1034 TaxID=2844381 RepID=UPI001CCABCB7|nr:cupin domain-containing protein [Pseudonocardia sp. ICBG1034]